MASYRRKNTKRRRKADPTLADDLFKIIMALVLLVAAIIIAFVVFRNAAGFKLPDLKIDLPTVEESSADETVKMTKTEALISEETASEETTTADGGDFEVESRIAAVEASIEEREKYSDTKEETENTKEETETEAETRKKSESAETEEKKKEKTKETENTEETPDEEEIVIIEGGPMEQDGPGDGPAEAMNDVIISNEGPLG